MHDLFQYWGQGTVVEVRDRQCISALSKPGRPLRDWPPIGSEILCDDNHYEVLVGQDWWISFDFGIYFLEELIE